MTTNNPEDCIYALVHHIQLISNPNTLEEKGDYHFCLGELDSALTYYADSTEERVNYKRKLCENLMSSFTDKDLSLLNFDNYCSYDFAMHALIIAGGWNHKKIEKYNIFNKRKFKNEYESRYDRTEKLISLALKSEKTDLLAFLAYKNILDDYYHISEASLAIAERSISLYKSSEMLEWYAFLQRRLNQPSLSTLHRLFNDLPCELTVSYINEAFNTAMALKDFCKAKKAIDILDNNFLDKNDLNFTVKSKLLRSYVDFCCTIETPNSPHAEYLIEFLDDLITSVRSPESINENIIFAAKMNLALSVFLNQQKTIPNSVELLIKSFWYKRLDQYSPGKDAIFLEGFFHECDFGYYYQSTIVENALSQNLLRYWRLLLALRTILFVEDDSENKAKEIIITLGPDLAPEWARAIVTKTLLHSKISRDFFNLGKTIAEHCFNLDYDQKIGGIDFIASDFHHLESKQLYDLVKGITEVFESKSQDHSAKGKSLVEEISSILVKKKFYKELSHLSSLILIKKEDKNFEGCEIILFYNAVANQLIENYEVAKRNYESLIILNKKHYPAYYNLALIYEMYSDKDSLVSLLHSLDALNNKSKEITKTRSYIVTAIKILEKKQADIDTHHFIQRELSLLPQLVKKKIDQVDLSLVEATCLLALFRACDLDHMTCILAPFNKSPIPFEPTDQFKSALLPLLQKGIIEISTISPDSSFSVLDGKICFNFEQLSWNISVNTLALCREIRDQTLVKWPGHWREQSLSLARDLAVEECVEYMEYLSQERRLIAPDRVEARALFRELLELSSVSKCWYYIFAGVTSANDYRTKYKVTSNKVPKMILNQIRNRGVTAIEKGWDTQYKRISKLPRSHFSGALHDALTGWGERAFDEPIRSFLDLTNANQIEVHCE